MYTLQTMVRQALTMGAMTAILGGCQTAQPIAEGQGESTRADRAIDESAPAAPGPQGCRAFIVYGYDGEALRDTLKPPRYAWLDVRIGEEVSSVHGEGIWFARNGSFENLDYVARRVIGEDGTHERSHQLVHTTLAGEATVLYDQPVKNDGYDDEYNAAQWVSPDTSAGQFGPLYWYRGPIFAVLSVDSDHVGLLEYNGTNIRDAKEVAVDFEGKPVEVVDREPTWGDWTPPTDVSAGPEGCGAVQVIDGNLHVVRDGSESSPVAIERPDSQIPIEQLVTVQWLDAPEELPREQMKDVAEARRAKSERLLDEARKAASSGDKSTAKQLLAEALLTDGDNEQLLFEHGKLAVEDGHLEAAQHALVAAFDHHHDAGTKEGDDFRARLLHHLGLLAEAQGDAEGARELFQRSGERRESKEQEADQKTEPTVDGSGAASYQPTFPGLELEVCRSGATYETITLDTPDAAACRRLCIDQARCAAFTLILPGYLDDTDKAYCELQDRVTEGTPHQSGCIAWVKAGAE